MIAKRCPEYIGCKLLLQRDLLKFCQKLSFVTLGLFLVFFKHWDLTIWAFGSCQHMSFWVLSTLTVRFVPCWVFEIHQDIFLCSLSANYFGQNMRFWVWWQFYYLRFVTIWVLRFVNILVVKFCNIFFKILSQFEFWSFVTIWVQEFFLQFCCNFSFWFFLVVSFLVKR